MRTFISIDLPEQVRDSIAQVSREFTGDGVILVDKSVMHLSLHFLGDLDNDQIEVVKESMNGIKAKSFEVGIRGLDFFNPSFLKVIFARVTDGAAECTDIYNQISDSLVSKGIPMEEREYTPHVTIARVKRVRNPRAIVSQIRSHSDTDFGKFTASSVKLKYSELTPEGPIYTDLYELKF
ncbi:MAG: RNA 2',3'-cyclic phosphodiesterase [Candidatus Micrarchaeota archaeon]|nr:RNA 2',3'-cyclic phosphodiesterase [Candidatus Micrarchaeota archaeon]